MARGVRSSVLSLVAVLALAGCGQSPSAPGRTDTRSAVAAEAQVKSGRTQESFTGTAQACDGEVFAVTTVIDHQEHLTTRPSGGWSFSQHSQFETDGVGTTSGAKYRGHGNINTHQVVSGLEGGAANFTSVVHMRNIVQGKADNGVLRVHTKWNINGNGRTTVDRLDTSFECRG
jgi:hypothetical protein